MGDIETHETSRAGLLSDRFARLQRDHESRLREYERLLLSFNRNVNLVSRKSESSIYAHHILHCLALGLYDFPQGTTIVDWGSGGGLPAIPLAIAQPGARIVAIDAVSKKTQALKAMARRLELKNLEIWNGRAEKWGGTCSYSVSRATASLSELWKWHTRVFNRSGTTAPEGAWNPGLLCLKGGDLSEEIDSLRAMETDLVVDLHDLAQIIGGAYFQEKRIVHVHAGH